PETHLAGATGIASVDRATAYKAMAQVKQGQIVLAFCWAHVRRDFLEVLTGYAELTDWVVSWLEEIRELYQRNAARLEVWTGPAAGADSSAAPSGASVPLPVGNGTPGAAVPSNNPPPTITAQEQHLRAHVAHLAQ